MLLLREGSDTEAYRSELLSMDFPPAADVLALFYVLYTHRTRHIVRAVGERVSNNRYDVLDSR